MQPFSGKAAISLVRSSARSSALVAQLGLALSQGLDAALCRHERRRCAEEKRAGDCHDPDRNEAWHWRQLMLALCSSVPLPPFPPWVITPSSLGPPRTQRVPKGELPRDHTTGENSLPQATGAGRRRMAQRELARLLRSNRIPLFTFVTRNPGMNAHPTRRVPPRPPVPPMRPLQDTHIQVVPSRRVSHRQHAALLSCIKPLEMASENVR